MKEPTASMARTMWLWTAVLVVGLAVAAATLGLTALILAVRLLRGVRRSEREPPASGLLRSSRNGHVKDHQAPRHPDGERRR